MASNPIARKFTASPWWARVVAVVMALLLLRVVISFPVPFAVGVGLLALGALTSHPPVKHALEGAFTVYWRVTLLGCAVFFPLAATRALSDLVAHAPLGVAVVLLLVWSAGFCGLVWLISTEERR